MSEGTLVRRTYYLGIINGGLFAAFTALTDSTTVTAALIQTAVASPVAVGIAAGAMGVGWSWPSLVLANRVESRAYKMIFYRASAVGRWVTVATIAALLGPLARANPELMVGLVIAGFFVYSSWGGVGMLAFSDVVARHVPATRRGAFWAWRAILGGVLGFWAGQWVRLVLEPARSGLSFPDNYVTIFVVALVANVMGLGTFCAVRDTPGPTARRIPLNLQMALGPRLMRRDVNYRGLLWVRVCAYFARASLPLFVPFAISQLGVPNSAVGTYISISVLFSMGATFLWGRISDRQGNRELLLLGSVALAAAPALALVIGVLPEAPMRVLNAETLRQVLFPLVFAAMGFAAQGVGIGDTNYLLEIAPPRRRVSYIGFLNVVTVPLFALPALAGFVAKGASYYIVFGISSVAGVLGAVIAASLQEPRTRTGCAPRAAG